MVELLQLCHPSRQPLGAERNRYAGRRLLFPDRLRHRHRRAGAGARGARFRLPLRPGAYAHPDQLAHAVLCRRRIAETVLPYPRPVCRAVLCRRGDEEIAGRHRICLIPERDPIVTAKCVASLDQLSGGRFIFGIGGGWNVEEMENHGARYETRFRMMRERILAMKALWTREEASFHGRFVNFDPVWSWPKPKQRPHPPILLGGESDYTLRRIVDYCNGWIPRPVGDFTARGAVDRLRRMAERKGRDPKSLMVSVFRAPADEAALAEYRTAGIDEALLEIPDRSRDEILQTLDRHASLAAA